MGRAPSEMSDNAVGAPLSRLPDCQIVNCPIAEFYCVSPALSFHLYTLSLSITAKTRQKDGKMTAKTRQKHVTSVCFRAAFVEVSSFFRAHLLRFSPSYLFKKLLLLHIRK